MGWPKRDKKTQGSLGIQSLWETATIEGERKDVMEAEARGEREGAELGRQRAEVAGPVEGLSGKGREPLPGSWEDRMCLEKNFPQLQTPTALLFKRK